MSEKRSCHIIELLPAIRLWKWVRKQLSRPY